MFNAFTAGTSPNAFAERTEVNSSSSVAVGGFAQTYSALITTFKEAGGAVALLRRSLLGVSR